MKNPIKCIECGKVFGDNIQGSIETTLSTEITNDKPHILILCNRCKKKTMLISK